MKSDPDSPNKPEVWLRGPIPEIPALLQPTAHALLQALEDAKRFTANLEESLLWIEPGGRASIGFHLQHLTGVLDRMLTYAKGKPLSDNQFDYLKSEGKKSGSKTVEELLSAFDQKINEALDYFKVLSDNELTEYRTVGRKELPSTVIGLLFHAAEHAQRHLGQILVTVSFLKTIKQ